MIHIRESILSDGLAIKLRPEDEAEALLYQRGVPPAGLLASIEASASCITFEDEQGVIAIFGIVEDGGQCYPWLMCSESIEKHACAVGRYARRAVRVMRQYGDMLVCNYISKHSHKSRAFIERLGFRIVPCPTGDFDFFYLPNV